MDKSQKNRGITVGLVKKRLPFNSENHCDLQEPQINFPIRTETLPYLQKEQHLKRVKVFVSAARLHLSLNSITTKKLCEDRRQKKRFHKTPAKLKPNTSREPPKQVLTNRSHKIIKITSNLCNWHCLYLLSFLTSQSRGSDDPSFGPPCDAIPTVFGRSRKTQTNSSSSPVHINGCSIPCDFPFIYKTKFISSCNKHDVCYSCVRFKLAKNVQCIE